MKRSPTTKRFARAEQRAALLNSTGRKTRPAALIFLLSFILFASGCIGLTSAQKPGAAQQGASISLAPASIRFGSVPIGSTASQSVTISNGGTSDLTVTQATTAAAGIKVTGISLPLVIPAGKQSTFDVVFSPKVPGALSGAISVTNDGSSSASTVSLSGLATAATSLLTTSTTSASFGGVPVGKSGTVSITLTNPGNSDVTVSKVTVSGGAYSATGVSSGLTLSPGQSATLDAKFSPVATGSLSGSVVVASNATNSPATIALVGDGMQASSHSVTLSWNASPSAVAGYNVYRSESSGGPYSKMDASVVPTESFVDANVQAGLTYYYVITSVTPAGLESADSTQASATVPTP